MNKKSFSYFAIFSVSIILLSMYFVLAAPNQVKGAYFTSNTTPVYDEGNFSINWTAVTNNTIFSYNIYRWVNSSTTFVYFGNATNDSAQGYSFNNWTEGNYTFRIAAINATDFEGANSTNISIYVDTTPPVITLPQYTNATFKKNTSTLTLNISVSDAASGLTGSVCLVDINGTNKSVAVDSGWCNSTAFNLTGLADGNQTIKVYVNDTVNNFGLNNTYVVQIDNTPPTATASCTPSNPTDQGETVTCTCSGSDTGSGVASSTPTLTAKTSTAGTFSYTCSVRDKVGNSVTVDASYIVSGSGIYSGGGGGGATTSSTKSNIFTDMIPGKVSIMKNFDGAMSVKQIQISVNKESKNVKITILKYNTKPTGVSVEKTGKVYQYIHIKTENLANNLQKAILTIKVNKSWISSNGLDKNNISLFRFDNTSNKWNELSTSYNGSDSTYDYFNAELTHFSYFAISEKTILPKTQEGKNKGVITNNQNNTTNAGNTGKKGNWTWLWIIIIVLIAIIVGILNREKIVDFFKGKNVE